MFDLKQHIASLVAVFLSLGIGIFIGMAIAEDGGLARQQAELVQKLEDDYAILRAENKKFAEEALAWQQIAEQYQEFAAEVFPHVIQGKLEGMQLAVFVTGAFSNYAEVVQVLEKAGAQIGTIIEISGDWNLKPADWRERLPQIIPLGIDPLNFLGVKVGAELAGGRKEILPSLGAKGFLLFQREGKEKPLAVVILGGSESKDSLRAKEFDLPLIRTLVSAGVRVVAGEASMVPFSDEPLYRRLGIQVIKAADTIPGQIKLIWALAGNKDVSKVK
ncbi:MAG: hypothetical protein PWP65_1825 [Clostridia bacterium]|nr:hypothetical protein [Clostridia bacterium]